MIDQKTKSKIIDLYKSGVPKKIIWKTTGVSRPTINKILKAAHATKEKQVPPALKKEDTKKPSRAIDPFLSVSQEAPGVLAPKQQEIKRLQKPVDSAISRKIIGLTWKTVGFTPRSLLLYDVARKKGFIGTFDDFVNICIYLAMNKQIFRVKNLKPRYIHPRLR